MNRTLQTTLLGALGGFIGFAFAEVLAPSGPPTSLAQVIVSTMVWTALFVLPLTLLLLAAENVLGMRGRWSRGWGAALIPTLLLGAFAGGIAQLLYTVGLGIGLPNRMTRALGWAVMGAGIGLVLGLLDRSWVKAWRGMLGGAAGGFVGGLLFDSFGTLRFGEGDTGILARAFGLTVLGAAIGYMLRLSQEFFKSAWLMGTAGRYEGKQYILTKPQVTLGRSDSNDIGLYYEPNIPLKAGTFQQQGQNWQWVGENLAVNGQVVPSATLRHGDRLSIGQTAFVFQTRAQVGSPVPVAPHQYMLEGAGQIFPLPAQFARVALGTAGEVKLTGAGIQARHAELLLTDGRLELLAHGPVTLNGQALSAGQRVPVRVDDRVQLGGQEFQLIRASLVPTKA